MPSEMKPVVKKFGLTRSSKNHGGEYTGTLGEVEVVAGRTGMGMRSAAAATERIIAKDVDCVLVVGIAGGVVPTVAIGEVVVPERVFEIMTGLEYGGAAFGDVVPAQAIVTSDKFTIEPAAYAKYIEQGVVAVDMETAAVADTCAKHDIPWTAFRSVSDRLGDDLVDEAIFRLAKADGSPDFVAVAKYVAGNPLRIKRLARLGKDAARAANAAAAAAHHAAQQWAAQQWAAGG